MKLILMEAAGFLSIPLAWWLFKRFAGRNIRGDILAGALLGFFSEFAAEPLFDYHFKATLVRDIPLIVILYWGLMYSAASFYSEKLYKTLLRRDSILPYDKRILLFDMLAGSLVGFPLEALGTRLGLWNYRLDLYQWTWGTVPFFGMPYEVLAAYALQMLTGPTFVRCWEGSFEGARTRGPR